MADRQTVPGTHHERTAGCQVTAAQYQAEPAGVERAPAGTADACLALPGTGNQWQAARGVDFQGSAEAAQGSATGQPPYRQRHCRHRAGDHRRHHLWPRRLCPDHAAGCTAAHLDNGMHGRVPAPLQLARRTQPALSPGGSANQLLAREYRCQQYCQGNDPDQDIQGDGLPRLALLQPGARLDPLEQEHQLRRQVDTHDVHCQQQRGSKCQVELAAAQHHAQRGSRRQQCHGHHHANQRTGKPGRQRQHSRRTRGQCQHDTIRFDIGAHENFGTVQVAGPEHADSDGHDQGQRQACQVGFQGLPHQFPVTQRSGEGQGNVRSQQGRDHHGTDDDGDIVFDQPDRRHNRGQEYQQQKGTVEARTTLDAVVEFFARLAAAGGLGLVCFIRLLFPWQDRVDWHDNDTRAIAPAELALQCIDHGLARFIVHQHAENPAPVLLHLRHTRTPQPDAARLSRSGYRSGRHRRLSRLHA